MADPVNNDVVLGLRMEMDEVRATMVQFMKAMTQMFSSAGPIQIAVEGQPNFGKAIQETGKLEAAVRKVGQAAAEVDKKVVHTNMEVARAAKALNQIIDGSSKRIKQALRAGGVEGAQVEIGRIADQAYIPRRGRRAQRDVAGILGAFDQLGSMRVRGMTLRGKERPEVRQLMQAYRDRERLTKDIEVQEKKLARQERKLNAFLRQREKEGGPSRRFLEAQMESTQSALTANQRAMEKWVADASARGLSPERFQGHKKTGTLKEERARLEQRMKEIEAQLKSGGSGAVTGSRLRRIKEVVEHRRRQLQDLRHELRRVVSGEEVVDRTTGQLTQVPGIEHLEDALPKTTVKDIQRKMAQYEKRAEEIAKTIDETVRRIRRRLQTIGKRLAAAQANPGGFWGRNKNNLTYLFQQYTADLDILRAVRPALMFGEPGEAMARAQHLRGNLTARTVFKQAANDYVSARMTPMRATPVASAHTIAQVAQAVAGTPAVGTTPAQQAAAGARIGPSLLAEIEEIEKRPVRLVIDEAVFRASMMKAINAVEAEGVKLGGAPGGSDRVIMQRDYDDYLAQQIAEGRLSESALKQLPIEGYTRARVTKSAIVRTKHGMLASIDEDPIGFLQQYKAPKSLLDLARTVTGPIKSGSTDPKEIEKALRDRVRFAAEFEEFANNNGFGSRVRGRAAIRGFEQRYLTPLRAIQQRLSTRQLGSAFSRRSGGGPAGMTEAEAAQLRAIFAQQHGMLSPSTTDAFTSQAALQQQAYKERFSALRNYQKQFIRWLEASTAEERRAGADKLKAARDHLRMTEQMFIESALPRGQVAVPRFRVRDGRVEMVRTSQAGQMNEMMSSAGAFRVARGALETHFGQAFGRYQLGQDQHIQDLVRRKQFDRAAAIQPANLLEFARGVVGGNRQFEDVYLRSLGFTKKMLQNEKLRAQALKENVEHMRQFVNLLERAEKEAADVNRRIETLEKLRQGRAIRSIKYGGMSEAANRFALYSGLAFAGFAAMSAGRAALGANVRLEQQIAGIQGVLSGRSPVDAGKISDAVRGASVRYGTDLNETADAARVFAQAGLAATDVIRELDTTMLGVRGIGLTIEEMQELQIAVLAITRDLDKFNEAVDYTALVTDKIARVEAGFAVMGQDLANSLKLLAPVVNQFTDGMVGSLDVFDQVLGMTTVIVEQLRVSGNQAANSLKFMFSRLMRPQILKTLQEDFGARLGSPDGSFLPLNEIMEELALTYQRLRAEGRGRETQFAVALSGGRQVNAILALLQQYERSLDVARESSRAFGDAQERTNISLDTLQGRLDQLRESMKGFVGNLMESTNAATALKAAVSALTGVSTVAAGGGTLATLGILLGGGGAIQGGKALFQRSVLARDAGIPLHRMFGAQMGKTMLDIHNTNLLNQGLPMVSKRISGVGGRLVAMFGPGALLATGLIAIIALFGKLYDVMTRARREQERYGIAAKDLFELGYFESPQFQQFQMSAQDAGFQNVDVAYREARRALLEGPNVRAVLRQFGSDSPTELLDKMEESFRAGRVEFEGVKEALEEAFVRDLPAGLTTLDEMEDKARRVAISIRLAQDAILANNLALQETIEEIETVGARIFDDVLKNLPNELERKINVVITPHGQIDPTRQVLGSLRRLIPDLVEGAFVGEGSVFYSALERSLSNFVSGDRLADVLDRALKDLKTDGWDEFVEDLARNAARSTDILAAAAGTEGLPDWASRSTASERVVAGLAEAFQQARERLPEILGIRAGQVTPAMEWLDSMSQIFDRGGVRIAYALDGMAEKFGRFENEVLDTVLRAYEEFGQLRARNELSQIGGRRIAFNPVGEMIRTFENMFLSFSTLTERLDREILMLLSQADNLGVTINQEKLKESLQGGAAAVDAYLEEATGGDTSVLKQLQDQRDQLIRTAEAIQEGQAEFATVDFFEKIIPNHPTIRSDDRVRAFLTQIRDAAGLDGAITGDVILNAIREILPVLDEIAARFEADKSRLDRQIRGYERQAELLELQSELELDVVKSAQLRRAAEDDILTAQILRLQYEKDIGELTDAQFNLKKEELEAELEMNRILDARRTLIEAQNALTEQGRDNITTAISGIKTVLSDMNTVNMKGRDIVKSILGPIADATYGRFVESFFANIGDALAKRSGIASAFETPELRLKNRIELAHQTGGDYLYRSIVSAYQAIAPTAPQGLLDRPQAAAEAVVQTAGATVTATNVQVATGAIPPLSQGPLSTRRFPAPDLSFDGGRMSGSAASPSRGWRGPTPTFDFFSANPIPQTPDTITTNVSVAREADAAVDMFEGMVVIGSSLGEVARRTRNAPKAVTVETNTVEVEQVRVTPPKQAGSSFDLGVVSPGMTGTLEFPVGTSEAVPPVPQEPKPTIPLPPSLLRAPRNQGAITGQVDEGLVNALMKNRGYPEPLARVLASPFARDTVPRVFGSMPPVNYTPERYAGTTVAGFVDEHSPNAINITDYWVRRYNRARSQQERDRVLEGLKNTIFHESMHYMDLNDAIRSREEAQVGGFLPRPKGMFDRHKYEQERFSNDPAWRKFHEDFTDIFEAAHSTPAAAAMVDERARYSLTEGRAYAMANALTYLRGGEDPQELARMERAFPGTHAAVQFLKNRTRRLNVESLPSAAPLIPLNEYMSGESLGTLFHTVDDASGVLAQSMEPRMRVVRTPGPNVAEQLRGKDKSLLNPDMLHQLATMAGAMGGAKLGGGGQGAGIGSSIGAMMPMLFSMSGPWAPVVGLLGGLAGGLLGGLFDSNDDPQNNVIAQLQAIEREQKETVQAIEQQTDALLSPESRLINAPASFRFPQYAPTVHGGINITVQATPGMDEQALARRIRAEVSDLLSPSGRTRARGSR